MALTDNKELAYGYFSQTLLPDYIEEHGVDWDVVYDARGHFEEPHTNRRIGCGTIEVGNYLAAAKDPDIVAADFAGANVDVIGPSGNLSGILFCEKEGFNPLFRAVKLADRYDLMIISTKGVSVTAARRLIDDICGDFDLPLFVLHDFDVAGFMILGTLQRDTRRFPVFQRRRGGRSGAPARRHRGPRARARRRDQDRTEHPAPAARREWRVGCRDRLPAHRARRAERHDQRRADRDDRAQAEGYGLEKVVPDDDLLAETYRAFHRSQRLREKFKEMEQQFDKEAALPRSRKIWSNGSARSSPNTPICGGTTLSRSCWTQRSSIACGRRRKRPKGNPGTSRRQ